MTDERSTAVKSADRTLTVLEYLSTARSPRSLAEIANELGIPKSSLHGLLRNLESRGWVSTDEADAGLRYRVGPQALTVGASYLLSDDIVRRSSAMLDSLSFELGETVHLGVLENVDVMYLAKRDARHNLRLVSGVGVRLPAYATALGKVLLAELDASILSQRLSSPRRYLTPYTLVDERVLRDDLAETKRRGYGIDNQESTEGVRCFAVALGGSNPRRHAVSCSVPLARLDDGFEAQVVSTLRSAAANFSEPEGFSVLGR